jgi:serine/threonine protein kinase
LISWPSSFNTTDFHRQNECVLPISERIFDFDFYSDESIISRGQLSVVRCYRERSSGELIAMKCFSRMNDEPCDINRLQKVFLREIEIVSSISHPCVVSLVGYSLPISEDNLAKIGTDFVDEPTLESILLNRPAWFDWSAQVVVILGIALGMVYIHSKGIIHRDLKPSNIFLDSHHRVTICDFATNRFRSTSLTQIAVVGAPLYRVSHPRCSIEGHDGMRGTPSRQLQETMIV